MADNITIAAVGANKDVATDDIGSVHYQRFKLNYGIDGAAVDASTSAPLPVNLTGVTSSGPLAVTDQVVSTHQLVTAASANAANIKSSSAYFRGITGFNYAGYPIKVCLHNTTGAPSAGAAVAWQHVVQAGTPVQVQLPGRGRLFSAGLGITVVKVAVAGDISTTGATNTAANDAQLEVIYE